MSALAYGLRAEPGLDPALALVVVTELAIVLVSGCSATKERRERRLTKATERALLDREDCAQDRIVVGERSGRSSRLESRSRACACATRSSSGRPGRTTWRRTSAVTGARPLFVVTSVRSPNRLDTSSTRSVAIA